MEWGHAHLETALEALENLPVFVAYNANVDAIVRVDDYLEAALDRPEAPGENRPQGRLDTLSDLALAMTHAMATGRGDELTLTDEFAATLEATLTPDTQQLGGQAGIMSNLLSAYGAAPILYTYLLSERQRSQFDHPERVRYPLVEDGAVRPVPLNEAPTADRTKINWVFEFAAGDDLFDVRTPEGSRFIAASRPPEFDLYAGNLDAVIDQVGAVVDGALLAGYHTLTPEHSGDYERAHRHARDVIRRLRSGSKDGLDVHVEYVVTHDDALRESIAEWILPEATVIGLDEHELHLLQSDAGLGADESMRSADADPEQVIRAQYRQLESLRKRLGADCLRLHAMEYHLAVMEDHLPPEAVRRGLEFAAINAATKAARGHIKSPTDLETGLEYEPSKEGRDAITHLADDIGKPTADGTLCTPTAVACPNRVVANPAGTVGIGDIVSASSFALELAVANAQGEETE
ncbi:ADP-dependent glucokinase/phosphofructokinase [Natronosalvus vescus]|uniref:ADP-dependent glucokinase/phosphofructokinase n=1 Tax=Natronosalvus vescus TaxID=2953881 RepID=UPI002091C042|nr:ADP-dependent glucokinase/phosphofructokinase [Natronosalvus vescus]